MDGVILTPLKQILHPKGDIFHAMKATDPGFSGFGEAYFSTIHKSDTKGWKKHLRMTLNLVVPLGAIRFVVYREQHGEFFSTVLSRQTYARLTVAPGLWVAFSGLAEENMLLNLASLPHDPAEAENRPLEDISYDWESEPLV